jgi:hypothetical protein
LSSSSIARAPHKHAEVIHAWADGAQIQWRNYAKGEDEWSDHPNYLPPPAWLGTCQYRVKPEPPAKVYPVTQMALEQIMDVVRTTPGQYGEAYIAIANAALRHAIDAGQVIAKAAP